MSPISSRMTGGATLQTGAPVRLALASNEDGAWVCGACGSRSASIARFCWNCGQEATRTPKFAAQTPIKITPGEPVYINSSDLNICPLPRPDEISYVQVDSMRAKAPVASTVHQTPTFEKLMLHSLIPNPNTTSTGNMEHDGTFLDVSDGASTTVSDNDNSNRSTQSSDSPAQEMTTLMVCPLPYEVSSDELLEAINGLGFSGLYDFVYMPSRSTRKGAKSRKGNVGYAFVNFTTQERATEFAKVFEGYSFADVDSERLVSVKPAACQGYTANFAQYLSNKKKKQGDFMTFPTN